ncbi:hypothetical protein [Tardiphaga sp.]|uniref:hypothetical protein n=1 Tax=Tardiphaga sp. TaxID=1926292 RepID=UPI002609A161|nr:hypothetical protein [Tardiphaga sp.]MDB5618206.1 hypothetical protein [Tardiphaga sp.]
MTIKRILGLTAVAGLLVLAAPTERAGAMSLVSPGIAAAVQSETATGATEVRWHRGWRHRHHRRHWRHRHW